MTTASTHEAKDTGHDLCDDTQQPQYHYTSIITITIITIITIVSIISIIGSSRQKQQQQQRCQHGLQTKCDSVPMKR